MSKPTGTSSKLMLARLKTSFSKNLKGPSWMQSTITWEELRSYLMVREDAFPVIPGPDPEQPGQIVKPEFKILYYAHEYDKVAEFTFIFPGQHMWIDFETEPVKVPWEEINWNGFGIHRNNSPDFTQVLG